MKHFLHPNPTAHRAKKNEDSVFIGIDLAWKASNPSGGAVIRAGRLVAATGTLGDNGKIVAFIAEHLPQKGGAGVDVILDMVGGVYLQRNISLLKVRGRLVWIATLGGGVGEINIGQLMGKRARLIGSVLRARPLDEKLEIVRRF